MVQRIEHLTVSKQPEVQMRARIPNARPTDLPDPLACFDPIADLHVVARQVRVE